MGADGERGEGGWGEGGSSIFTAFYFAGSSLVLAKQSDRRALGVEEPAYKVTGSVHVLVKTQSLEEVWLSVLCCVCVELTQCAILLSKVLRVLFLIFKCMFVCG